MFEIEGVEFRLFWDTDRPKLTKLSFLGRAKWLQMRTGEILLKPLDVLKRAEGDTLVWLAGTELICAGIHSLAGFYGNGQHGQSASSFCRFVHTFMHGDFSKTEKNMKGELWSYCQHLETYFRNPLDHGFAIEWGGIWNDGENGMVGYLRPSTGGGIAIDPNYFLEDFRQAVEAYFQKLIREGEKSFMGQNFQGRFNRILNFQSTR